MAHGEEHRQIGTIRELRKALKSAPATASLRGQVTTLTRKEASNGKEFWELRLRDESDSLNLRAWPESASFALCESLQTGAAIEISGEFFEHPSFGPDARSWRLRELSIGEATEFFAGNPQRVAATDRDYQDILDAVAEIADPRLRALCDRFLQLHGDRFRRAAAARNYHHARRGGLCAHTAQMLRTARAVSGVYPALNRDLLLAGIVFHDAGKLWETCPPASGFDIRSSLSGELLGHISIGIELINRLWQEIDRSGWESLEPDSETVRLHLLHLVASHHGEYEFGSPVLPKTPEALALHAIDNLDAKLEMIFSAYETSPPLPPGIYERIRALNVSPIEPLPALPPAAPPESSTA